MKIKLIALASVLAPAFVFAATETFTLKGPATDAVTKAATEAAGPGAKVTVSGNTLTVTGEKLNKAAIESAIAKATTTTETHTTTEKAAPAHDTKAPAHK